MLQFPINDLKLMVLCNYIAILTEMSLYIELIDISSNNNLFNGNSFEKGKVLSTE